ncbi:MAG: hypothetical protein NE327_16710 [Lentisphaeraceae bacterium]|nr:hypothetical protein [Lentisphaeraceae bacterium]
MLNSSLTDISKKLEPIEINNTLNNQNLVNTINSLFLMAGTNMLYLTDEETDGRIYFKDHHLISTYWNDEEEETALLELLKLDYAGVKIIKNQEPEKVHFKMSIEEFLKIAAPDNITTIFDLNLNQLNTKHLQNISFIKGFLALKDNVITVNENIIPDAVPIDYLRSLIGNGDGFKGIYCKVNQLQGKQAYYIMIQEDYTWIFQLKKNADRDKIHNLLSETIKKVLSYV